MTAWPEEDREAAADRTARPTRAPAWARTSAVDSGPGEVLRVVPSLPAGKPSRVRARIGKAQAARATLLEKQGTLLHSQPPTFIQAHTRHQESAAHFRNRGLAGQRMAYGWFHLTVIKPSLNYAEWATESELRLIIHVLLGLAVWLGLLLGGYL